MGWWYNYWHRSSEGFKVEICLSCVFTCIVLWHKRIAHILLWAKLDLLLVCNALIFTLCRHVGTQGVWCLRSLYSILTLSHFSRFVYTGHRCPSSKCSNQLWLSQNGWDVSSSYWSLWEIWSSWDCNQFDNVRGPLCSASHRARTWHRDQTYSKSKEFKLLFFFLSFFLSPFVKIMCELCSRVIFVYFAIQGTCVIAPSVIAAAATTTKTAATANNKFPVFRYSHYMAHKS